MTEDDNIVKYPGKYKAPTEDNGPMLVHPPYENCKHYDGPFEVDVDAGDCVCKKCGERVTAIFVLQRLMNKESQWMRSRAAYQDEMKRLAQRSRTKCQHCNQMTRISRK